MLSHPPLVTERSDLTPQAPGDATAIVQLILLSRSTKIPNPLSVAHPETGHPLSLTEGNLGLYNIHVVRIFVVDGDC